MSKGRLIKEFFQYIAENKKLWLIPILFIFGIIGLVVVVSQSQALAPFIYTLF